MRYLICYDIPEDRRRARLAKFLLDYGDRVQYSVFEFELNKKTLDLILKGIVEYINTEEDSVRVYSLCSECAESVKSYGPQRPGHPSSLAIVV